jgi:signal transduction histidine kinase
MAKLTFKPRARLMLLLGDQLIRDSGIAVFELVKNAYDADATKCKIMLNEVQTLSDAAQVIVEDNGSGMTSSIVKDVWLSPGTRYRLTERETMLAKQAEQDENAEHKNVQNRTDLGRLPLGEKGLGRFAVHKLGDSVRMVTRAKGCKEVVVIVDWLSFDNDKALSKIPVKVIERTPKHFTGNRTGTRLEISKLRDLPWSRNRVRSLFRSITSICSPIAGPERFDAEMTLSPDPNNWLEGLLTAHEAMELALFRFKGVIENVELTYDYEFAPLRRMHGVNSRKVTEKKMPVDLGEEQKRGSKKPRTDSDGDEVLSLAQARIGPITIELRVFDRDPETLRLLPGNMNLVKEFLDNNGGVRVYRDNVRVYDFGEPGNDWLNLGGRRVNVPTRRIGNNQVIGIVKLELSKSSDLIEKTNREGFVENLAYRTFQAAVRFAITQAEAERNIDKKRLRQSSTTERKREPVLSEVSEMRGEIRNLNLGEGQDKKLSNYLDRIEIQYREILDRLLTAAGAGMNLAVVLHEVEKGIKTLHTSIQLGQAHEVVLERAKQLADIVDGLTWLTRQSGTTEIASKDLIRHCLFAWSYRFEKHGIEITNGAELDDPPFTVRGTRRLLMTALMNLIDNSIYWVGITDYSLRN